MRPHIVGEMHTKFSEEDVASVFRVEVLFYPDSGDKFPHKLWFPSRRLRSAMSQIIVIILMKNICRQVVQYE